MAASPEIQVMELRSEWVDATARSHQQCFSPEEVSIRLGLPATRRFYRSLVDSPHGKCVIGVAGADVLASVCVFTDYVTFHRRLARRLLPFILRRVIAEPTLIRPLWRQWRLRNPIPPGRQGCHLGALFLRQDKLSIASLKAFKDCYEATMAHLTASGTPSIWTSVRQDNQRTLDLVTRQGFVAVQTNEGIVFLEKTLG